MRVVRLATRRPDASNGSITEVTHSCGLAPLCRLLEDISLFIPHLVCCNCLRVFFFFLFFFLHVVRNKCGLRHFRYFVQLIKVTVSFESLLFVRSILYFCFCVCFFPCLSLFYFQLSVVIEVSSVRKFFLFSSSRFLIFHSFCAFSSLGFSFLFLSFLLFFFPFPASFQALNSPTLSRHGSPLVRSSRSLSNKILFDGCVTIGSHCSPGFSPLSLVILTWLRTGLKAFLVVTFQQTSLCLLSRILLSL